MNLVDTDRNDLGKFVWMGFEQGGAYGTEAFGRVLDQQQRFVRALDRIIPAIDRLDLRQHVYAGRQPRIDQQSSDQPGWLRRAVAKRDGKSTNYGFSDALAKNSVHARYRV